MRRTAAVLVLIAVVALIVRIGVIAATPNYRPLFDAKDYERHAHSIADGHGYPRSQLAKGPTAFRPPLYPVTLAVVFAVGGGRTAARLAGALMGVVAVLLLYEVARRIWGRRVAIVAAAIAAVFPPIVVLSASLLSELLFIPLVLATLLAVLIFREDRRLRWAIAVGVGGGLAALTRTNGLLLVLATVPAVWVVRPRFSRAALLAPVVAVVATLLTITPWTVRNAMVFHRFVGLTTQGGYALASTYNAQARRIARHPGQPLPAAMVTAFKPVFHRPDSDEVERVNVVTAAAFRYMRANPVYVVETAAWNVLRVGEVILPTTYKRAFMGQFLQGLGVDRLASPLVRLSLYVVGLVALFGAATQLGLRRVRRAPLVVWAVPVVLILPALGVYGLARYRSPVDPFIALLAAVGAVAVYDRMRGRAEASAHGP